jgi:fatty-acyl-CoA synthase
MPDDILFVPALPHTATGKLLKRQLRDEYRDVLMSQSVAAS